MTLAEIVIAAGITTAVVGTGMSFVVPLHPLPVVNGDRKLAAAQLQILQAS